MHKLSNRFNYLRGMEALAAIVIPFVFVWDWAKSPAAVNWPLGIAALLLQSYLLVQGACYWHLKHCALSQSSKLPDFFGRLFSVFRASNLLLFALVALAFGGEVHAAGWSVQLAWPLGIFVFAMIEHINYYHYQLMYDTTSAVQFLVRNRRLRRAALGIDLKRATIK